MPVKKKFKLGELAIFAPDTNLDNRDKTLLRSFNFALGIVDMNDSLELWILTSEVANCGVEILEEFDSIPWCYFPHLGLMTAIGVSSLRRLKQPKKLLLTLKRKKYK